MTRRVVQWSATNYDREELQVIQVFEEGLSKQDVTFIPAFADVLIVHKILKKAGG